MPAEKNCCFLSFDYVDFDVFLNARIFYRLAGYSILPSEKSSLCNLLVVFRGIPPRIYKEHTGPIHFYDYVCEHSINLSDFFPNASSITVISIDLSDHDSSLVKSVCGYLPVFPSLWQLSIPFSRRSAKPLHISNYKPLVDDPYQQQLITLIKAGIIRVYGAKWDGIQIKARPLSYLSANLKLASASLCFGLMYPYQRGKSLSGRMWQAPLHGCIVISETRTNLYSCPGVFEVSSYEESFPLDSISPSELASEAALFWIKKTKCLADDLNLSLNWNILPQEVVYARVLMFRQHCDFLWDMLFAKRINTYSRRIASMARAIRRKLPNLRS
jgi:hypothetical protein